MNKNTFQDELIGYFYGAWVILGMTLSVGAGYIWGNRGSEMIIYGVLGLFLGVGLGLLSQGLVVWMGNKKK